MGVEVVDVSATGVVLEAPIQPNLNHNSTAFGGSVAAVAILAGWTLTAQELRRTGHEARTVIQKTSVHYEAPIHGAFRARCGPLDPHGWERCLRALERHGRGRIRVPIEVVADGVVACHAEGLYVALAGRESDEGR